MDLEKQLNELNSIPFKNLLSFLSKEPITGDTTLYNGEKELKIANYEAFYKLYKDTLEDGINPGYMLRVGEKRGYSYGFSYSPDIIIPGSQHYNWIVSKIVEMIYKLVVIDYPHAMPILIIAESGEFRLDFPTLFMNAGEFGFVTQYITRVLEPYMQRLVRVHNIQYTINTVWPTHLPIILQYSEMLIANLPTNNDEVDDFFTYTREMWNYEKHDFTLLDFSMVHNTAKTLTKRANIVFHGEFTPQLLEVRDILNEKPNIENMKLRSQEFAYIAQLYALIDNHPSVNMVEVNSAVYESGIPYPELIAGPIDDVLPGFGERALTYWAHQINPVAFERLELEHIKQIATTNIIRYGGSGLADGVASDIFLRLIKRSFIWTVLPGIRGASIYQFMLPGDNNVRKGELFKWVNITGDDSSLYAILEKQSNIFGDISDSFRCALNAEKDKDRAKLLRDRMNNSIKAQSKMKTRSFLTSVINSLSHKLNSRQFAFDLDKNGLILGVGNGVLLLGAEPRLITTFHEYPISQYTDADYLPYNPADANQARFLQTYREIFTNKEVRHFMRMYIATGCLGTPKADYLVILTGAGRNGKTILCEDISAAIGEHYSVLACPSLITMPSRDPNAPNSAFMALKNKRLAIYSETGAEDTLNDKMLKKVVSSEKKTGNEKFQKQENFDTFATNLLATNHMPLPKQTSASEFAIWRRIYAWRIETLYVDNPMGEFEKKADSKAKFRKNDHAYRSAVLSVMIHDQSRLFRRYDGDIERVCKDAINAHTEEYRNACDLLNRFLSDYIIVDSEREEPLTIIELASHYTAWLRIQDANYAARLRHDTVLNDLKGSKIRQFIRKIGPIECIPGHGVAGRLEGGRFIPIVDESFRNAF